jgi:hypothetical protein
MIKSSIELMNENLQKLYIQILLLRLFEKNIIVIMEILCCGIKIQYIKNVHDKHAQIDDEDDEYISQKIL